MALQILGNVQKMFKRLESAAFWQMNVWTVQAKNKLLLVSVTYVDEKLEDHIHYIGLYAQDSINTSSLVLSVKDVLCQMNLKVSDCREQYYDGACNISGAKNGVVAQWTIFLTRVFVLFTCYVRVL